MNNPTLRYHAPATRWEFEALPIGNGRLGAMVFGGMDAVKAALDSRDGNTPSLLNNAPIMDAMRSVDSASLWSVLDQKGTQTMMKQVLGEAGSVADYDSVRKRLLVSWYGGLPFIK